MRQQASPGCDDAGMTIRIQKFRQPRPATIDTKSLAALLIAASLSQHALAQAGADCVPGGTTAQTNACAIKDFQQADTDHQILYGDVMRALSAHERPALRKEQGEWSRHRITQCKQATKAFEAQPDWPSRYHGCLVQQITARDAVLKRWLHQGPPD
ncbi:lysozyme inhibitor LprI family protein [Comamonas thiooxydans]|uniref:lysozyme inhibitor LprI family protein n=1 Tax=Comamonas thiooxydans TaxID=363952 RepID=UPI000AA32290